jgi:hypothetical protein
MPSVYLAVADRDDAVELQNDLGDFGVASTVIEGCDSTIRAVRSDPLHARTVVVDSKLIATLAKANRNLIRELKEAGDKDLRVLVLMTKSGKIENAIIRDALSASDSVVHAPASSADVRLRIKSLQRTP